MGGDKPLRVWRDSTLVANALAQARRFAPATAVSVRRRAQLEGKVDATLVVDDPDIPGPLAGLAAALEFAAGQGAEAVLTVPCDTPLLPEDLGPRLASALERSGEAAALAKSHGELHPTSALWRVSARDALTTYAASGRASLRGFASEVGYTAEDWGSETPDPFAGANTPEELAGLEAQTSKRA